jgi:uncharacterized protein
MLDIEAGVALRRDNIDAVQAYLEAINRWDFAAMRGLLHPAVTYALPYAPPGFARRTQGRDAVMAFLESIPATVVDGSGNLQDVRIEAFASDPNELLAEYTSDMKLIPTGRRYRNEYLTRLTMSEGCILHFREYFDPIRLVAALESGPQ